MFIVCWWRVFFIFVLPFEFFAIQVFLPAGIERWTFYFQYDVTVECVWYWKLFYFWKGTDNNFSELTKNIINFYQKIVTNSPKYGLDTGFGKNLSRIQGWKRNQIPDLGSATLLCILRIWYSGPDLIVGPWSTYFTCFFRSFKVPHQLWKILDKYSLDLKTVKLQ